MVEGGDSRQGELPLSSGFEGGLEEGVASAPVKGRKLGTSIASIFIIIRIRIICRNDDTIFTIASQLHHV